MLKNKFLYITISIIIAIALALLKTCNVPLTKAISEFKLPKKYIDPPFEKAVIPRTNFEIDAQLGAALDYGTTKIEVPTNAFLDKEGKVFQGKVNLAYREVNDPASILMSGVPMKFGEDSSEQLESAGMLEMVAFSTLGVLLFVNPSNLISVNMESDYPGTDYNLYNLDTVNRTWVENASSLPVEQMKTEVVTIDETSKLAEPNYDALALKAGVVNPVKPKEKSKELFQFKFKTDFTKYPELNIYNGVQWEFAGKKKSENPAENRWVTTAMWSEMKITKRKRNGIYVLHLVSGSKEFTTTVKPVFDANDMEYAEYVFGQTYDKYRGFVDAKKEEARQGRIKQEKLAKQRAQREKVYELSEKFTREFNVTGFGWCNVDRILRLNTQKILASFVGADNEPIIVDRVFLVIDSVNSVLTYYQNGLDDFTFSKDGNNRLIVIDSMANAYALGNSAFERINAVANKHQFLVGKPIEIESEQDVRKLLAMV
jgi:hypothetical protein